MGCGGSDLESAQAGKTEADGYFDMHHTCGECGAHFDHLEGVTFEECGTCGYRRARRPGLQGN